MKITEYPEVTSLSDDQVFIVDGGGFPTSKIKVANMNVGSGGGNMIANPEDKWIYHRNTYRGKDLGNVFTERQKAMISDNSFEDIYVGDYWEINGYVWRVADINYWLNTGDTPCTTPHAVIVPDGRLGTGQMNTTASTAGGYVANKLNLGNYYTIANNAFGNGRLLSHREYLTSAVTNGVPSAGQWGDTVLVLMTENMVYGSKMMSSMNNGTAISINGTSIDNTQLSLFRHNRKLITAEQPYWLRDVVSATQFCQVSQAGNSSSSSASSNLGIRPVFGIIG